MFKGFQEHKYYVIHTVISFNSRERLFPFTFESKSKSDSFLSELKTSPESIADQYFPNDAHAIISPFIYFEKTIISKDTLESDDALLSKPTGRLTSEIIPMDFISNLYFSTPQPQSTLAPMIEAISLEANRGVDNV